MKATTCYGKVVRKHGKGRGDIFLAKANVTSIFPYGNSLCSRQACFAKLGTTITIFQ